MAERSLEPPSRRLFRPSFPLSRTAVRDFVVDGFIGRQGKIAGWADARPAVWAAGLRAGLNGPNRPSLRRVRSSAVLSLNERAAV
jgi:hypothetical protein